MEPSLEKLYKVGLKLLLPLTAQESYSIIVEEAVKLVNGKYGSIVIREKDKFNMVYASSPIAYRSLIRPKAFAYKAFLQKKAILVPVSKLIKAHPEFKDLGIKYTIYIPLSNRNKSIGVLIVNSKEEQVFGTKEIAILKLFGSFASLAIRKNQLYEETSKALELRDHFISMAAHELRTPLTSVNGYVQLLHSKLSKTNTTEARWVEQLYQESQRLKDLIDELLQINQIKSGKLNYLLKEYSLKEIIERVKSSAKFSFPGIEIIIEDKLNSTSDHIIGDYDKLLQMFINLIDNAVRFSPPNSPVRIILDFKNHEFVISVKDEGIGIAKKDYLKIFEGYHPNKENNKESMGLGLFLVKDVVAKLHGSIKVHSKVGKGTTMEIRIPKVIL